MLLLSLLNNKMLLKSEHFNFYERATVYAYICLYRELCLCVWMECICSALNVFASEQQQQRAPAAPKLLPSSQWCSVVVSIQMGTASDKMAASLSLCQRWRAHLCLSAICASVNCYCRMQIEANCICITFNHRVLNNCSREGSIAASAHKRSGMLKCICCCLFSCWPARIPTPKCIWWIFDACEIKSGPTVPYGMLACDSVACKCATVQKTKPSLLKSQISLCHACRVFLHTDIHNAPLKALSKQRSSDMHTESN